MSPNLMVISEGKKFMWDGRSFDSRDEGLREAAAYKKDNFEVWMVEQDGKFHVYTRRVVKEVVVAAT